MPRQAHFTPSLFQFLRDLAKNNTREWFLKNKPRYDEHIKDPMLRFITDLAPRMAKVSKHIEVSPKLVGGSMQRINRDTRFSKDKSPYKPCAGAMFGHSACGDLKLGYHLSLTPGPTGNRAYVGLWEPDGPALDMVRTRIMVKPDEWKRAVGGKFAAACAFEGESLKRPPKVGDCVVEPDHPFIEDLKRKSHAAAAKFDEKAVCSADFLDKYVETAKLGAPVMAFLCGALKVPF